MDRTRLTITLKKDILRQVDATIDGAKIRNRSHAIEYLLTKSIGPKINQAVILAGGQGVKMRPFTYEMPKSMIPVGGRPILEHIINNFRENNIRDIILCIDYLGEKIKQYFSDGSKFGVKITYVDSKKPIGTAASLLLAKKYLKNDAFLLWHGDVLADIDINDFIDFYEANDGLITMALTSVDDPSFYGSVKLRGNRVVGFKQKPGSGHEVSRLINAGIYAINKKVLNYIPAKKPSYLENDVFPKIIKENQFLGYVFEGKWFDISTPKIYERALKEWQAQ